MDTTQKAELRHWAEGLAESGQEERTAAGRSILLLLEEDAAFDRRELEGQAKELLGSGTAELRAAGRALRSLLGESAGPQSDPTRRAARPRPSLQLRPPSRRTLVVLGALVALAAVLAGAVRAAAPDLAAEGPDEGAVIGREALASLTIAGSAEAEWLLDGAPVEPERDGATAVWRPGELAEGEHELVLRQQGPLFSSARKVFRFVVDTTAPVLAVDGPAVVGRNEPLRLQGKLEPGATLLAGGQPVAVDDEGRFELTAADPPRSLVLTASDPAGNTSRWQVPVTLAPRRPAAPIRSVHVTAYAWANESLREGVMALVRDRKVNAIELDLKDEAGEVGWASGVPLAKRIGAQLDIYDLQRSVDELHRLGVRVIGRIVCFRDPIHAQAAWKAGRRNEVVQAADGSAYAGYGGFTNFAHPAVRKYNIDLAVSAAKLGVDEILYDYVRRPDGPLSSMRFPGLEGTPETAIVEFLRESRKALAPTKALVGASVFGVAATRPEEVAQDIPAMAREVDYIAPMLYPSHWGPGEYGVADPNGQPYEIVLASTRDFVKQVRGTGARIVNWLQDFSYGRDYGPAEVRAQIRASKDAGADEFILWDAAVDYTADALDPTAQLPALEVVATPPDGAPMPKRLPDASPAKAAPKPKAATAARPLPGLEPNELGRVPVVMHHMVRPDRVGEYDQTPAEFLAELEYLWKNGYVPVSVGDLLSGKLSTPKGTTPVAFTFDDATTYQIDFDAKGRVKPKTAVGIMLEFARTHPGFVPAGTFYVNRTPFGSDANAKRALRWLTENGFEIGNHTHGHIPLNTLPPDEVRKQIATGAAEIRKTLPGYPIRSLSLPLGAEPADAKLAVEGEWEGQEYGPYAVLLVGADPAPSPFSKEFDRAAIPRIRTSHAGWDGEADYAFSFWMREAERDPGTRFVSDGDPATVTVPKGSEGGVAARFESRIRTR